MSWRAIGSGSCCLDGVAGQPCRQTPSGDHERVRIFAATPIKSTYVGIVESDTSNRGLSE